MIDIAHPEDRAELVRLAKAQRILYSDQTFMAESGRFYPEALARSHTFREGLSVRFRAIKPSDEEEMRRLFYRFSDQSLYYRYFSPIKTMPHEKMQEYVNIDYRTTLSIVGLTGEPGQDRIIAEARYAQVPGETFADVAFIVDEAYQGRGIAAFLLQMLIEVAKERGIRGFSADVLGTNRSMLKVFEKAPFPVQAVLDGGAYRLKIDFTSDPYH